MLTRKDCDTVRRIFREELEGFLLREITVERGPRTQGDPERTVTTEQWNILDWLAHYLPLIEGALRGMQEDVDLAKCDVARNSDAMHLMAQALSGLEEPCRVIASAAGQSLPNSAARNLTFTPLKEHE